MGLAEFVLMVLFGIIMAWDKLVRWLAPSYHINVLRARLALARRDVQYYEAEIQALDPPPPPTKGGKS